MKLLKFSMGQEERAIELARTYLGYEPLPSSQVPQRRSVINVPAKIARELSARTAEPERGSAEYGSPLKGSKTYSRGVAAHKHVANEIRWAPGGRR